MAAIWVCFTEGRTPCPTLAAFCQYLGSPRDGGGELREMRRKGRGRFLFSKHRGAFHVSMGGVWWATINFCPVEFKLGYSSWATTWEWQFGSEFLECGPKANTVLSDTGSAASSILRPFVRCFHGSGD